ncbi:MAG: DUF4156 domain-containing protein [Pseudohongiellaceae bacterium]
MMKNTVLILTLSGLISCTWVKVSKEGEGMTVATLNEVATCRVMGTTVVALRDRIWRIKRNPEKVRLELETLARNRAAVLNGDTIVPIGPITEGEREYRVYLCQQD